MLTGRTTFDGRTASDVLAGVLRAEPDWNLLPPNLHPRLREVLERCLEKEAKNRWHDIADVRVDLDKLLKDPVAPVARRSLRRVPIRPSLGCGNDRSHGHRGRDGGLEPEAARAQSGDAFRP